MGARTDLAAQITNLLPEYLAELDNIKEYGPSSPRARDLAEAEAEIAWFVEWLKKKYTKA